MRRRIRTSRARLGGLVVTLLAATGVLTMTYHANAEQTPTAEYRPPGFVLPPDAPAPGDKFAIYEAYHVVAGTQTYTCNAAGTFVGTGSTPEARLVSYSNPTHVIHHYAGPRWTFTDKSTLLGTVQVRLDKPPNIQWLLLSTVAERPGYLGRVAFVSRVNTKGGTAPTDPCTPGATVSVPYGADYVFWAPAGR